MQPSKDSASDPPGRESTMKSDVTAVNRSSTAKTDMCFYIVFLTFWHFPALAHVCVAFIASFR